MTVFCGIDYSINSPALCIWDSTKELTFNNTKVFGLSQKRKYVGIFNNIDIAPYLCNYSSEQQQYDLLSDWVLSLLHSNNVEYIGIEDYAFRAMGRATLSMAENTGILKYKLHKMGIKFDLISPSKIKKQFTDLGSANKETMLKCFQEETGTDLVSLFGGTSYKSGPVADVCDSFAVLKTLSKQFGG